MKLINFESLAPSFCYKKNMLKHNKSKFQSLVYYLDIRRKKRKILN